MNNLSRSSISEKDITDQSSQYPLLVLSYDSRKGSVTPWAEKTKVNIGDVIKFKFDANESYEISNIRINGNSLGSIREYNLKITNKREYRVEVLFKLKEVNLLVKPNNPLWGTVSESTTLPTGMTAPIKAIPKSDKYRFVRWVDEFDNTISTNESIFTPVILTDTTYIAEFEEIQHNVSVRLNLPEAGKVSLSDNKIGHQGTVTVMLDEINEGYEFSHWSCGRYNYGSNNTAVIGNITDDINVVANFRKSLYQITGESYPKGLGVVTLSNSTPSHGDKVIASSTIPIGYMITKWVDDKGHIIGRGPSISIIADSSKKIFACFEKIRYKITVFNTNTRAGEVIKTVPNPVEYNRMVKIIATPNQGYHLVNFEEDGVGIISLDSEYVITNTTRNRNIRVNWEANKYNIEIVGPHKNLVKLSNSNPRYEDNVTVITPEDIPGYKFSEWIDIESNKSLSKSSKYTFKCLSDIKLKPIYVKKSVKISATSDCEDKVTCHIKSGGEKYDDSVILPNYSNVEIEAGNLSSSVNKKWSVSEYIINGELYKTGYSKLILVGVIDDLDILVKCTKRKYKVQVSCEESNGKVSISSNEGEYEDKIKISAKPNQGYKFDKWINNLTLTEYPDKNSDIYLNESNLGKITSFNSHPTLTLTAIFKKI